jgi:hypothetical protein
VQVALFEINNLSPRGIEDERVLDVPFLWNGPIENLCPGRYFKELEWDVILKNAKRFTDAIAGNASTDGEQLGHQLMHERPAMLKLRVERFPSLC